MYHFTYSETLDKNTLKQGDILLRTPELVRVLEEYHSYFANPQYTHFQILTQTCDLVRRNGNKCKSRYITIAAVRSLSDTINRYIETNFSESARIFAWGQLFCNESQKAKLTDFLRKLFNNNDSSHFFLKAVPEVGLNTDSCTWLLLSIPLKADLRYDVCLNAKRLELKEEFRAKLGWLVGDLYSRVGTADYVPSAIPDEAAFSELIKNIMDSHVGWVPSLQFPRFKTLAPALQDINEVSDKIEKEIASTKQQKMNHLLKAIKGTVALTAEQEKELQNKFSLLPVLREYLG